MTIRIGFIGLGIMGLPMCKNLLKGGYRLTVCDINSAAVATAVESGAYTAGSPQEVAAQTDVIITMLPDSPDVKKVVLGPAGVIAGARPGATLIDMSSINPLVSQEISAVLAEKGINMLDAPVSGGESGAINGTLSIMVGGNKEVFAASVEILQTMGTSVVLIGDNGAGNVAKLANQVIVALNIAAVSEAMVLATKAGVDPERVFQAIKGGLAGSHVMDAKFPMMLEGNATPGFRVNLHIKDLNNAIQTSHAAGAPLPLTAVVMEIMQALQVDGLGSADHSAVIRFYEKLARIELRRQCQ